MRFGSTKNIAIGQIYRSTNRKFIQIEAVNETHFRYMIIQCKKKKGRPRGHVAGAVFTVVKTTISNYIGPIEFTLEDVSLW